MWKKRHTNGKPLPDEFLDWQVELRKHTALERGGMPHVGVAPLVTVKAPGTPSGSITHSIICGLLPAADRLEHKTLEFRDMYQQNIEQGARAVYDAGISYLEKYYDEIESFDPLTITTLMTEDLPLVQALRANPRCSLLFYVFDLQDKTRIGRFRCTQLDCIAEILSEGLVYENVWWHNALFHGPVDDHVVLRFAHQASWDTSFGRLEAMGTQS